MKYEIEEDGWLDNYLKFGFWQLLVMLILTLLIYFGYAFITNEWTETFNAFVQFFTTYSVEQRMVFLAILVVFGLGGLIRKQWDNM